MRDLAEFIMRGRWQALAVAVIGSVLVIAAPVSAAAIALVTLGRSMRDGAWVALWSMLPALLLGWVREITEQASCCSRCLWVPQC